MKVQGDSSLPTQIKQKKIDINFAIIESDVKSIPILGISVIKTLNLLANMDIIGYGYYIKRELHANYI